MTSFGFIGLGQHLSRPWYSHQSRKTHYKCRSTNIVLMPHRVGLVNNSSTRASYHRPVCTTKCIYTPYCTMARIGFRHGVADMNRTSLCSLRGKHRYMYDKNTVIILQMIMTAIKITTMMVMMMMMLAVMTMLLLLLLLLLLLMMIVVRIIGAKWWEMKWRLENTTDYHMAFWEKQQLYRPLDITLGSLQSLYRDIADWCLAISSLNFTQF